MKTCKKYAMRLHRSASLHSRRLLRRRMLPTLAMGLPKMPQSEARELLATKSRPLPRTSLIIVVATPQKTRTASMLGPFQGQQVLSRSHLFHLLIIDSTLLLQNRVHPHQSQTSTTAPSISPTHYQDRLQR